MLFSHVVQHICENVQMYEENVNVKLHPGVFCKETLSHLINLHFTPLVWWFSILVSGLKLWFHLTFAFTPALKIIC